MLDNIGNFTSIIDNLKMNRNKGTPSPHKLVFLLALLDLYEASPDRYNSFPLDDQLELAFYRTWRRYFQDDPGYNAIEHPYYHLQTDGLWKLKPKNEKMEQYILMHDSPNQHPGKKRLVEVIDYGYFEDEFHSCLKDKQSRRIIATHLSKTIEQISKSESPTKIFERLSISENSKSVSNNFVTYLNSLHCSDAGSENALAEFQACNPFFSHIRILHPLVDKIRNHLLNPNKTHLILTGHAGDGKSTIALELFKELKGFPVDQPLSVPLNPREDLTLPSGKTISIIKDLSEWGDEDKQRLLSELLEENKSFLLVSNTGTLLNTFADYGSNILNISRSETEPLLLGAIDSEQPFEMEFGENRFLVFNLALQDNLSIAKDIFIRMLDPGRWIECGNRECHNQCPIYRNVSLIHQYQDRILDRMFIAYRRMYEYGTRLTLRQLTAHLAYLITAGLDCKDIFELSARPDKPLISEFMFYNRFFGDNGKRLELPAIQLQAIQKIRQQCFGEQPCPTWERRLWLLTRTQSFNIGIYFLEEEFDRLRCYGSGESTIEDEGLSSDQAREQVRRMLYFLYDFPSSDDSFIRHFLNSPAILKWWKWQENDYRLSLTESNNFKRRVFHVLQEQFTGIRLPEDSSSGQTLYITLSRKKQEIRQSAQVVLAQIDFGNDFSLALTVRTNSWNIKRRDLCLIGNGKYENIRMPLTLPFLDYVLMRQRGEAGEVLQAAYSTRLEQLKSQLIQLGGKAQNDDVLLVRLRTNHTFARQTYSVRNNKLEVA